jgi:hypothetical protein
LSSHTKDYFQNQFITYKKSSFDIIIKLWHFKKQMNRLYFRMIYISV